MSDAGKSNISKVIMQRLKLLGDLPHFPEAIIKLEQLLSSGIEVHLSDVAGLVAQDPRLTAGIIGVVNSARYSPGFEITNIEEAVQRLGTQDVRMMAHAINYQSALKTKPPFSEKEFMEHAMRSAFIAQTIAKALHFDQGEAFLCGLMHDLGIYLLATESRDKYKKVMASSQKDSDLLIEAEQKVFGTNHAVMGARLLQQWRFSKKIVMGVAGHHMPEKSDSEYHNYAYLAFLAEKGAYMDASTNGIVTQKSMGLKQREGVALNYFGISAEYYQELVMDALSLTESAGFA